MTITGTFCLIHPFVQNAHAADRVIQLPLLRNNKILQKAQIVASNSMAICIRPKRAVVMRQDGWKKVATVLFSCANRHLTLKAP